MTGATSAHDLDAALQSMASSQHTLLEQVEPIQEHIHACTDITGFGLLGHLGETPNHSRDHNPTQRLCHPAYSGAFELFERGVSSTLAPSNRAAWRWLEGPVQLQQQPSAALLELLVDPQTCGPLLLAAPAKPPHISLGLDRGLRSATQQPCMSEIVGPGFTAETRLLHLRFQAVELALHSRRWPTAGQPELLRKLRLLQPLLQRFLSTPE